MCHVSLRKTLQDRSPNTRTCSVQKLVSPLSSVEVERMLTLPETKEIWPEIGIDCGFFGRDREDVLSILSVKCRNVSTGCLAATAVAGKGASDSASSYLASFIESLGLKRILVTSDTERSLERVLNNLLGVEVVLTPPEGSCS